MFLSSRSGAEIPQLRDDLRSLSVLHLPSSVFRHQPFDIRLSLCYPIPMSIVEIRSMSRDEQLLAMEMLWDELCHHGQEPESPPWHKHVLDKRQTKIAEGTAQYLTLDEIKKRPRR